MFTVDTEVFPINISYKFSSSIQFNNTVIETANGIETRVVRWYYPLHSFDVVEDVKSSADLAAIGQFYVARQGPARGFLFVDWIDCTSSSDGVSAPAATDQPMLPTSNPLVWQCRKQYTSGSITKNRIITRPYNVTVSVSESFTVDETTGLVTFSSVVGGSVIPLAGFNFYVPVRFTKELDAALYLVPTKYGSGSISSVPMTEVRETVSTVSTRYVAPAPPWVPPGTGS